jgi:aminoglycoside 3-N-acetyltransferase
MSNIDKTSPETLEQGFMDSFHKLGIGSDDNLYINGNLAALGKVRLKKDVKQKILLTAFQKKIGSTGTIFSPSASMNLCNTQIPFDIKNTPSHEMGSFAEYIRLAPESVRSFHPFWSISALGLNSERLCHVSRNAYGAGTPWEVMLDLDVRQVTFGIHPSRAVTLIHHVETVTGAPYRYIKEFLHPVITKHKIEVQPFYQLVMYKNSQVQKRIRLNEHYFNVLSKKGLFHEVHDKSGLVFYTFKFRDFYNIAVEFFIDDMYNYLEYPPEVRPYRI